jgi:hypothetical protein
VNIDLVSVEQAQSFVDVDERGLARKERAACGGIRLLTQILGEVEKSQWNEMRVDIDPHRCTPLILGARSIDAAMQIDMAQARHVAEN